MPLTSGQRALLHEALRLRQHELQTRLQEQHRGASRAEHARALLQDGDDDAPQRDSDREVSLAIGDMEERELTAVSEALARTTTDDYGRCSDCDADIPFDRLKLEPWACRCVGCESARESAHGGQRHVTL
jgi:DnaK suppressor protein